MRLSDVKKWALLNVEAFHEDKVMVLFAPVQRSIDDILESYLKDSL